MGILFFKNANLIILTVSEVIATWIMINVKCYLKQSNIDECYKSYYWLQ